MDTNNHSYLELLDAFPVINLELMDKVKLMDRKDTKFIFQSNRLTEILSDLKDNYHVLWVNACNCCPYESIYYDTSDHKLFLDHHRGKLNRFKIRHRKYLGSETRFFEIKYKTNNDRTIKQRIKVAYNSGGIGPEESSFLEKKIDFPVYQLKAGLKISFNRITLVNLVFPERVTIDTELVFHYQGVIYPLTGIVIAESKQERTGKSAFAAKMKELNIREGSLSKYCMGLSLLLPSLKSNYFRPKIKQLKKLMYDSPAGTE